MSNWVPLDGMKKFFCGRCGHDFAAKEPQPLCMTCTVAVSRNKQRWARQQYAVSTFDTPTTGGEGFAHSSRTPFEED